ncbi:hypothetical protein MPER_02972 [Moniliophthora perniciosa FA553]|nr:hypothetical protein MPER_02972 [Moniliophthora perniciosa FA553]
MNSYQQGTSSYRLTKSTSSFGRFLIRRPANPYGTPGCRNQRLPSFNTRFRIIHLQWSHIAYTAIRQLHILKGFNPATRDLARSLDLPLLETVGDVTRFEEIQAQSIEDFQPMDVDSGLAVSLSTLTVDVAEDAMDVD